MRLRRRHCLANRVKVALELTKLPVPVIACPSDHISKLIIELFSLLGLRITKGNSGLIAMRFDRSIDEVLHIPRHLLLKCPDRVRKLCVEVLVLLSLALI